MNKAELQLKNQQETPKNTLIQAKKPARLT